MGLMGTNEKVKEVMKWLKRSNWGEACSLMLVSVSFCSCHRLSLLHPLHPSRHPFSSIPSLRIPFTPSHPFHSLDPWPSSLPSLTPILRYLKRLRPLTRFLEPLPSHKEVNKRTQETIELSKYCFAMASFARETDRERENYATFSSREGPGDRDNHQDMFVMSPWSSEKPNERLWELSMMAMAGSGPSQWPKQNAGHPMLMQQWREKRERVRKRFLKIKYREIEGEREREKRDRELRLSFAWFPSPLVIQVPPFLHVFPILHFLPCFPFVSCVHFFNLSTFLPFPWFSCHAFPHFHHLCVPPLFTHFPFMASHVVSLSPLVCSSQSSSSFLS